MVSLLPTKFHEILFSSFRGVVLTNCVTDRRTGQKQYVSPQKWGGVICKHSSVISLTETCIYMYIHVQESIIMSLFPWKSFHHQSTLECLQITPTKFRGSTFPRNMHNYIWCPYYLPSFMKFCSVVSEELRWQTVWQTDGQDKNNMSSHKSGGRHNYLHLAGYTIFL
jgi:hypothetical protein